MPGNNKIVDVKKKITSRISQILSGFGLDIAECGFRSNLKEIDPETGYWSDTSLNNKPPRMLIHLRPDDRGGLRAEMPEARFGGNNRIAYVKTDNQKRKIAAVFLRVLPVMAISEDRFLGIEEWEWVLYFCFYPALGHRSSSSTLSFDPTTGRLQYQDADQSYIAAGLVTLGDANNEFVIPGIENNSTFTYAQATRALQELLRAEPPRLLAESPLET